jgi:hypothetical protein
MSNLEQEKNKTKDQIEKESSNTPKEVDVKKEKKKESSSKKGDAEETVIKKKILEEKSVNLIPVMSREEVKKEDKKSKTNKASLISLLIFFSISIAVVGFNIISQIQLNHNKEKLLEQENRMLTYNQLIIDNNQILQRVFMYKDVQRGRYSTTEVVDYIQNILSKSGGATFSSFGFLGRTGIDFSGQARDLEEVAKLWYLLTKDEKINSVVLKSLSKGSTSVNYSFEANLVLEEFVTLVEN